MTKSPTVNDVHDRLEVLSREECLRLLAGEEVCRVAVVDRDVAHVTPVNYVLDGDAIVFRTGTGAKLYGATRAPLTIEVDRIDATTRSGWSVVARGVAQEITAADRPDLQERLWGLGLEPWPGGERDHLLRVTTQVLTGRRIAP